MAEQEKIEGLRPSKSTEPTTWGDIPTAMIIEKNPGRGMTLEVDFVTVILGPGGSTLRVDNQWGVLIDNKESTSNEEEAVNSAVESLLDGGDDEFWYDDEDTAHKNKLSDEEAEQRARDYVTGGGYELSESDLGFEVLNEFSDQIKKDEAIPKVFTQKIDMFWSNSEGYYGTITEDEANTYRWMTLEEDNFLNALIHVSIDGDLPSEYGVAVMKIMDRVASQDFGEVFRGVVPVWAYLRLKCDLKEREKEHPKRYKELREAHKKLKIEPEALKGKERDYLEDYIRLEQMRSWLKKNKETLTAAARRMLDKKDKYERKDDDLDEPVVKEKGKQMSVEGKKTKVPLRFNPETYTEKLLDYYDAVGKDPEVPIDWLIAEGATPDQIFAAADELLKTGRIDPPDYWAITATLSGVDSHVVVPRGNPAANEELAGPKKSLFKTAKEGLKEALKRMTTIEVVGYESYEPPEPPPTTEESMESLERSAEEAIEPKPEVPVMTAQEEWQAMFDKERKEHPTVPEEIVRRIVDDHMGVIRGLKSLGPKNEKSGRENPSGNIETKAAEHFWNEQEYKGPKAVPMGDEGADAERRDVVRLQTLGGDGVGLPITSYYLWDNLIARLSIAKNGHRTFHVSTSGYTTQLTRGRLQSILRVGKQRYPILRRFDISTERGTMSLFVDKPHKEDEYRGWTKICPIPESIYGPDDIPRGKMPRYSVYIDLDAGVKENLDRLWGRAIKTKLEEVPTDMNRLDEVQVEIDKLEKGILDWRAGNNDYTMEYLEVAQKLGTRQRYEDLLKQRDELMWRGNPKSGLTKMDIEHFKYAQLTPEEFDELVSLIEAVDIFDCFSSGDIGRLDRLHHKATDREIVAAYTKLGLEPPEENPKGGLTKMDKEHFKWGKTHLPWKCSRCEEPCLKIENEGEICCACADDPNDYGGPCSICKERMGLEENPKIPYTPPNAPDVEVKCPVTDKYTWSCNRCALLKRKTGEYIECKAKKGHTYYLAATKDKRGTVWDTYVLPRNQRKAGIETEAIGGD